MITLLVKGPNFDVLTRVMREHRLEMVGVTSRHGDCFVTHTHDHEWKKVMDWFGEDVGKAPFPEGSLLHFKLEEPKEEPKKYVLGLEFRPMSEDERALFEDEFGRSAHVRMNRDNPPEWQILTDSGTLYLVDHENDILEKWRRQ